MEPDSGIKIKLNDEDHPIQKIKSVTFELWKGNSENIKIIDGENSPNPFQNTTENHIDPTSKQTEIEEKLGQSANRISLDSKTDKIEESEEDLDNKSRSNSTSSKRSTCGKDLS